MGHFSYQPRETGIRAKQVFLEEFLPRSSPEFQEKVGQWIKEVADWDHKRFLRFSPALNLMAKFLKEEKNVSCGDKVAQEHFEGLRDYINSRYNGSTREAYLIMIDRFSRPIWGIQVREESPTGRPHKEFSAYFDMQEPKAEITKKPMPERTSKVIASPKKVWKYYEVFAGALASSNGSKAQALLWLMDVLDGAIQSGQKIELGQFAMHVKQSVPKRAMGDSILFALQDMGVIGWPDRGRREFTADFVAYFNNMSRRNELTDVVRAHRASHQQAKQQTVNAYAIYMSDPDRPQGLQLDEILKRYGSCAQR